MDLIAVILVGAILVATGVIDPKENTEEVAEVQKTEISTPAPEPAKEPEPEPEPGPEPEALQ